MPAPLIPFASFTPDDPPYLSAGLQVASNTAPRARGGDQPLLAPTVLSDALPAACRGGFSALDKDSNPVLVTGTASALYVLSGASWLNRSPSPAPAVATDRTWRFAAFGDLVLSTNGTDPVYSWTMGSGTNFATLAAAAPRARHIAVIEPGFVMLGHYDDGTSRPNAIRWSGFNNATSWPTLGTAAAGAVQSDAQTFPTGGIVTGILPGIAGGAGAVFLSTSIYRMDYIGPPAVFAFREVDRSRGCIAPQSLAQVGSVAFFLSEDGFCAYDAQGVRQIGLGRVDRWFWNRVDVAQLERVWAAVDQSRQLVIWTFPSAGAAFPNRWLIYSYARDEWRAADDPALACSLLLPTRTQGLNLDTAGTTLDPDNVDTDGPDYDSAVFSSGQRFFGAVDTAARLVGYQGSALAARMEGGDGDAEGDLLHVTGIDPITDANIVQAAVGTRASLAGNVTFGTPTTRERDGYCPQRSSAALSRGVVTIPAGATWTYATGFRLRARAAGRR